MAKKDHVHFIARKPIKEPAVIAFETKNGPIRFNGHKTVKEKVVVDFEAKRK